MYQFFKMGKFVFCNFTHLLGHIFAFQLQLCVAVPEYDMLYTASESITLVLRTALRMQISGQTQIKPQVLLSSYHLTASPHL